MKETETQKAIADEAKEKYPASPYNDAEGNNFTCDQIQRRDAYIAGRSKSLEEKEKEIEDAWFKINVSEKKCVVMDEMLKEKEKRVRELEEALRGSIKLLKDCLLNFEAKEFENVLNNH